MKEKTNKLINIQSFDGQEARRESCAAKYGWSSLHRDFFLS
jgi:hypothetical protein